MAVVADYSIITDAWVRGDITFTIPENLDPGARCVLAFMIDVESGDTDDVTIRINGTSVWSWSFGSGPDVRMYREVIAAGIVGAGSNTFAISSNHQVSDAVIWWQAIV